MEALIFRASQEIGLLLIVGAFALLVAVPVLVWRQRRMSVRSAMWKTTLEAAIAGSLAVAVALTLGSFAGGGRGEVNLVPFQSLFANMAIGEFWVGLAVVDMVGNFLLFVPLGFAAALRFVRLHFLVWVLIAVLVTLAIEGSQLFLLNRSADITDVIMNASGAIVGFGLGRAVLRAWRRRGNRRAALSS